MAPIWLVAPAAFLINLLILPALIINVIAISAKTPKELILALQLTSFTSLLFATALCWGLFTVIF
jgi:1,4-dihydroxy-2-naphthoate octaprenyltransferase